MASLDIFMATRELAALCNDERAQVKRLGAREARQLRARLADLAAVARVTDLKVGHPHPLKGDRAGQFAVRLKDGLRLVFEPADDPPPVRDDGAVDWAQVTRVRIVFIGD